jgi:hypothetical protein
VEDFEEEIVVDDHRSRKVLVAQKTWSCIKRLVVNVESRVKCHFAQPEKSQYFAATVSLQSAKAEIDQHHAENFQIVHHDQNTHLAQHLIDHEKTETMISKSRSNP